jgi:hypothetical protein
LRVAAVSGFVRRLLVVVLLAVAALQPTGAEARGQLDLPWSLQQLFGVALRFVRVDRGCQVIDKDEAAAYIAFECVDRDPRIKDEKDWKRRGGSLELIPTTIQGRPGVRAQVTLAEETHGAELRFLELLERKVRDEKGPPPPPASKPTPLPTPDGGAG